MAYEVPPDLAALSLSQVAELVAQRKLPPIDRWQPAERIDSEMRIAADGRWYHQGSPIGRPAMVRAFSALLRRDPDGSHWLVTPQCLQSIAVEDVAFLAVDLKAADGALTFRLNTDEFVVADADHPLRAAGDPDAPAIYLGVRNGLEARLDRSTWLQLAELALARTGSGGEPLAVTSRGVTFPLVPPA